MLPGIQAVYSRTSLHDFSNRADISEVKIEDNDPTVCINSVTVESTDEMIDAENFCTSAINSSVTEVLLHDARSDSAHLERIQNAYKNPNCLQNKVGHILRRSERIKMKSRLKKLEFNDCMIAKAVNKESIASKNKINTAPKQNENFRRSAQKKKSSCTLLNLNRPLLSHNTAQVVHSRILECVEGDFYDNGKKYIIIKWKHGESEYVAEENLTMEMKRLLFNYHQAQLQNLQDNLSNRPEEGVTRRQMVNLNHNSNAGIPDHDADSCSLSESIDKDHIKIEKYSILEFKSQQKICVDGTSLLQKMGLDDPDLDLKLII